MIITAPLLLLSDFVGPVQIHMGVNLKTQCLPVTEKSVVADKMNILCCDLLTIQKLNKSYRQQTIFHIKQIIYIFIS